MPCGRGLYIAQNIVPYMKIGRSNIQRWSLWLARETGPPRLREIMGSVATRSYLWYSGFIQNFVRGESPLVMFWSRLMTQPSYSAAVAGDCMLLASFIIVEGDASGGRSVLYRSNDFSTILQWRDFPSCDR